LIKQPVSPCPPPVNRTSPPAAAPLLSNPVSSSSSSSLYSLAPRHPWSPSLAALTWSPPAMVLAEALRARLLAALRPWLAADPAELRVEPGLCRSRAVARGVELDVSALNAAAGESLPARFDRAAVAEVELAASPWAGPALRAVVRGVDVALTLRDPAPKKQRPNYKECLSKEKKRVLASLDPQGQMLHETFEGVVNSLEDKFTSVFSSVLLNCGQVRLDDVTVQVRYLDDSHVIVLRATDLQFGPELVFRSSLFRGLVGSFMSSRKKNSLFLKCTKFDILLKENDSIDCAASFTGISASVRLDNLQLCAFGIHVPNASWEISPKFIPSLMVILDITSQKEEYGVRNGRELWAIAAQVLDNSVVHRRYSLSKAISCAAFWRRYVHAYVLLLTSVGYPSDKIMVKNCSRMSRNRKIWDTIKGHWDTVIDLEEKIPVEAIARARRAARSKLSMSQQVSKQEPSKTLLVSYTLKTCLSGVQKLIQKNNSNTPRRNSSFGTADFTEDTKIILWSDSARMEPFSGQQTNESFFNSDELSTAHIKSDMDVLWTNWMIINNLYEESGVIYPEKPSIIIELKSFLIDPYRSTEGFQQCRLTVGRLNLDLDYLCASSTYLLYRQFVHYKQLKEPPAKVTNLSTSGGAYAVPTGGVDDKLRSISRRMKVAMVDAIPENTLQIAALVDGPCIRLSFDKSNLLHSGKYVHKSLASQMKSKSYTVLSLAYIECALWPVARSSPTHPIANTHTKKSYNTFVSAQKLQEPHQNARLSFAGLTLLTDNPETNQQSHIFGPMSANFELSTRRNYVCSFFGTRNIISANLSAGIVGCAIFLYMDELLTVCQLCESMYSEALKFAPANFTYSQDFMGRLASFYIKSMMESTVDLGVDHIAQEETSDPHIELNVEMQLDLESADIICSASRDGVLPNPDVLIGNALNYISSSPVLEGMATQELIDTLALGVGFRIRSSSMKLLLDGACTDFLGSISRIHGVVFDNQSQMSIFNSVKQHGTMLNGSLHSKNQLFTSDCVFHLCGGPNKDNWTHEKPQEEYRHCCVSASLGMCYSIRFEFTEVYVGDYGIQSYLSEITQRSKQKVSLLIHDDLQLVKCNVQGGLIFLETISVAKLVFCCKIYFWLLMNLPLRAMSNLVKDSVTPISAGSEYTVTNKYEERDVATVSSGAHLQNESQLAVKCIDVELSGLSLTLVVADESGTYQGLTLEVDARLQRMNLGMKILFEVQRISISTVCGVHKNSHEQLRDVPAPRFRSSKSVAIPSQSEIQEYLPFVEADNILTYGHDAPSSSTSAPGSSTDNTSLKFSSNEYYILKHFSSYLKTEKKILDEGSSLARLSGDWFGNGSVSGLEIAMSLSNIEMILSLFAPFHGIMSSGSTQKEIQTIGVSHQAQLANVDYNIPDGAIVAIRDLNQQMYVSVKKTGSTYRVVGAYHYSLAGEHALFKVKHHKRWRSNTQCISLVSLCARNDEGNELSLSFSQGSDLVEVSSYVDKPCSIWSTLPFRDDNFEDDCDDGKSYNVIPRSSYHLVNKKNNCGIAFVDGLLEFVRRPGNPFKLQVLDESMFFDAPRLMAPHMNFDNNTYLDVEDDVSSVVRDGLGGGASSQHIIINVDKIVFTVTHEVFDTDNVFPLVQNCISDIRVVTQIFPSKVRILSAFKVSGQYFNARRNLWEELISPITSYTFFRSRFFNPDPVTKYGRMPIRFFFQLKQVDIFINELSFDILLYLAGKLDLMGPYAVKSSAIFPNCCKIENSSRLALVCHFKDNGDAIVPGQQSTSVFLRNLTFDDNHPHDHNVVSISLFKEGLFSTIPINVSLHESGIFSWRTRVSPVRDSRSFSGPFVVVKVSQNSEEGLSLSVQPLLTIYNKSDFPVELRFLRPSKTNDEAVFVTVKSGDMVDESTGVFDAMDLSGGSKRALMSLALGNLDIGGNFMLSIRPEISEHSTNISQPALVKWSEDITGEKAIRLSGVIDRLNYNLRKAFHVDSMKSSFSSLSCPVFVNDHHVTDLHFLIHTLGRDVPVQPTNGTRLSDRSARAPVALQFQREIFIYPTVQVYNFLQTDVHVVLTDGQSGNLNEDNFGNIGKQAKITSGSSAYFYVNPALFNFSVTLISYGSTSKTVNSSDWVKRMQKQATRAQFLDMELEFFPGKYHSSLRLLRQEKGLLEVALFTRYTLHNTSDYPLLCTASHQKLPPVSEPGGNNVNLPPQHGCALPSMSMSSWFTKSSKLRISLHSEKGSAAIIDLEAVSGFTEFFLEIEDNILPHRMAAFGVSLQPVLYELPVPSQVILIVPRYVILNESGTAIAVRQCYVEHEIDGLIVEAKQRATLQTWKPRKKREVNYFDLFVKKHRNVFEDSHIFIQCCPKEPGYSWSGPICVSSIGRFFLKFRRSEGMMTQGIKRDTSHDGKPKQFASVDVVQETTSFVLHFNLPPKITLPYRIENFLNEALIMYFQKDSVESDVLCPQESEQYVWDDFNTPALREIKIDKISPWKPFLKMRQNSRLNLDFSFSNGLGSGKQGFDKSFGRRMFKIGYEVYADGLTRVLRICEHADNPRTEKIQRPIASAQFGISYVCIHLLDKGQSVEKVQTLSTILTGRLQHVSAELIITDRCKHVSVALHSVNVDEKWEGASFGSILRRNKLQDATFDESIMRIIFILNSTNSSVKQIEYCSIILQIIASFRPGSRQTTYSSAQEALRALLHSVIKVPEISNSAVELNGVLLNHALVTFRELLLKCAQHYSWYVLRAIYVTKGSTLLPPSFASIFDDSASSVLDVFFDPSDGSLNLPGLTIGMFKFISKNMKSGGFSGTKRYFGDLGKTVKTASSNALFAAVTEVSDSVVRGAETDGLNGMVTGFHQGILRLAMEPSLLGQAIMEGGPDRKIKLDHSPGLDELYIEGYLQAMLDVMYKQEYLRVRVIDDQVILKNLPPNSALINEIVDNVKSFLVSKALLKGDSSTIRPLRHLRNETEWRIAPTVLTLCEHLFVSFAVRMLHREASKAITGIMTRVKKPAEAEGEGESSSSGGVLANRNRLWTVGRFAVSGLVAYVDGRLCRHIPNPIARRIVSGFLLSFIESKGNQ
ncbi:hypothetical protein EJB05_55577, partial [Eragrostis curvula]